MKPSYRIRIKSAKTGITTEYKTSFRVMEHALHRAEHMFAHKLFDYVAVYDEKI